MPIPCLEADLIMIHYPKPAVALCVLTALLAGCSVGPPFRQPDNPLRNVVLEPRERQLASDIVATPVPTDWWALFNDPLLSSLQSRAATGNLDLQAASARVAQSRAQLGIAGAALLPSVSAGAGYSRAALSEHGLYAAVGAQSSPYNLWEGGLQASWEIDLWGHAASVRDSARASAEASRYEQEGVRVAVAAEVARNYLLLRGRQTQLDIVDKNLDIARHSLQIAESRERNGVSTRFDTAAARAQLATTGALALQVAHERDDAMNALALLLGAPPRTLDAELRPMLPVPALPLQIPVGLPSELAQRRPDVLQAEARLRAATADIGTARADFYPRITLGASLGLQAFDGADMGNWSSRQFAVGPTIYLPIFEGGRLKSTLALTEARAQAAAIAYQKTVLTAWHEVDNAIGAHVTQVQRYAQLRTAYEQSQLALNVAQRSYQEGTSDYLALLVAQGNLLSSQSALAGGATAAALTLVDLYKALAGGWQAQALTAPALANGAQS
jgi:NodT family efflux transporter outer membrane factor (OMF) lipoprotein